MGVVATPLPSLREFGRTGYAGTAAQSSAARGRCTYVDALEPGTVGMTPWADDRAYAPLRVVAASSPSPRARSTASVRR